jgi:hypothetical protein
VGIVFTSEATQPLSVLWMYMDCNLSNVASCSQTVCIYLVCVSDCYIADLVICILYRYVTRVLYWSVPKLFPTKIDETVDGEIKLRAPGFHI